MKVFVKNMRGQALMPCSQRKARILLKQKKAKIVSYKPFTIQFYYATGEAKRNSKNTKQLRGRFLNDEVICFGQRGWISGFTGTSSAYVTNRNGEYIQNPNKSYKQVNLSSLKPVSHNANWQYVVA